MTSIFVTRDTSFDKTHIDSACRSIGKRLGLWCWGTSDSIVLFRGGLDKRHVFLPIQDGNCILFSGDEISSDEPLTEGEVEVILEELGIRGFALQ